MEKSIKTNINFTPLPPFLGGWGQTIAGTLFPQTPLTKSPTRHIITVENDERVLVLENRPKSWRVGDNIALLVHGLAGSANSGYMVRMAKKLIKRGFMVMRMNLRGCGDGFGLARLPYHSGRSEDTRAVLKYFCNKFPNSPVTQIGYSLGGNITLKMAGEGPIENLKQVVSLSPPINLSDSSNHLARSSNSFFDKYFTTLLRSTIKKLHRRFPELPAANLPPKLTLREFDDYYTAPRSGFKNAEDYYSQSSSDQFIPKITIPTLIIYSKDDPVVCQKAFDKIPKLKNLKLIVTKKGGHMGFLGLKKLRWLDDQILNWLATDTI
jgi:predicted alpha/beta-fold hydrolase